MATSTRTSLRTRRRRADKPAASARLLLDERIPGDDGLVAEDLFNDLFPRLRHAATDGNKNLSPQFIAIAPWAPEPDVATTTWTIVPVKKSASLPPSTVQFAPSSVALQKFAFTLQQLAPSRVSSRHGIEILVLDAVPLPLDTIFLSLDASIARRLENGEGNFFQHHPTRAQRSLVQAAGSSNRSPSDKLMTALRIALGGLKVVHSNDLVPLPLAPHPVTHVVPNPALVTLCEPVSQGILTTNTKIIVVTTGQGSGEKKSRIKPTHLGTAGASNSSTTGMLTPHDDGDEDATDQFFSAAEDRYKTDVATDIDDSALDMTSGSEIDDGMDEDEDELDDELSDDSLDEMISLQVPSLPTTAASGVSTMQANSPAMTGRGRTLNGIASPGSVLSNFTTTTARLGRSSGRLFRAQGLVKPIPSEILHPRPPADEDDEARVYVDITSLSRVGCFSGDWVRLEASAETFVPNIQSLNISSLGEVLDEKEPLWRPVKVFGLPDGYTQRPLSRIPSSKHDTGRKSSFFESQLPKPIGPVAFVSPFLITNMNNAQYFRISPLRKLSPFGKQAKLTAYSRPALAKSVNIEKIRSPISLAREYDTIVFASLRKYFASSPRIVRTGDLIALPIDTSLGKIMQEPVGPEGSVLDDISAIIAPEATTGTATRSLVADEVAWFRIGHIAVPRSLDDHSEDSQLWGNVWLVDSGATELAQTGSIESRIAATKGSNWQTYVGVKQPTAALAACSTQVCRPLATRDVAPDAHYVSSLQVKFRQLFTVATSKRALALGLPPTTVLLVSTQRRVGKARVVLDASADVGLHTFVIDAYDILNDNGTGGGGDTNTNATLLARVQRAMACGSGCTTLLIRHIEALTSDRMVENMKNITSQVRLIVATTADVDKIPDGVRGLFNHEIELGAPTEAEREGILRNAIVDKGVVLDPEVNLRTIALKTAALVAGDLVDVVERAIIAHRERLESYLAKLPADQDVKPYLRDVEVAGGTQIVGLTNADFAAAVDHARKNFSDAIGAPKIPHVLWSDVGGLSNVKDSIDETIRLPLERPELFARGMKKRSGILFYGPPGTGKTLLAKAIATEYSLNFFSVKGPELLNMYIGESEANVRRVFQRARDARPCVIFFDELDSVAPKRGNQGDSGGVMDRIVSQLLAELDGMSDGSNGGGGVFVIGATNRPDLLDPALLRPGRFDKMLYLGVADTCEKQTTIMEALTRKFTLHPSVSLARIAQHLPFTYTGADFYALCSDAMLKAITRQATLVEGKIAQINQHRSSQGFPREPGSPGPGSNAAGPIQSSEQPTPTILAPNLRHQFDARNPTTYSHTMPPIISTAYFFDHFATKEDLTVIVTEADFLAANRELIPSVSADELRHYESVRAQFEGVSAASPIGTAAASKLSSTTSMPTLPLPSAPQLASSRPGSAGPLVMQLPLHQAQHSKQQQRALGSGSTVPGDTGKPERDGPSRPVLLTARPGPRPTSSNRSLSHGDSYSRSRSRSASTSMTGTVRRKLKGKAKTMLGSLAAVAGTDADDLTDMAYDDDSNDYLDGDGDAEEEPHDNYDYNEDDGDDDDDVCSTASFTARAGGKRRRTKGQPWKGKGKELEEARERSERERENEKEKEYAKYSNSSIEDKPSGASGVLGAVKLGAAVFGTGAVTGDVVSEGTRSTGDLITERLVSSTAPTFAPILAPTPAPLDGAADNAAMATSMNNTKGKQPMYFADPGGDEDGLY